MLCVCEEKVKAVQSYHVHKTIFRWGCVQNASAPFLINICKVDDTASDEWKENPSLRHKLVDLVKLVWAANFYTYADSQSSKLHKHE